MPDKTVFNHKPLVLLTFIVFSLVNLMIVVLNHYFFRTYAYDYGVYNFAFYDYAHLRISHCPVYLAMYGITFLQDHFSLILMLLSPLYWVTKAVTGTYTLLGIQWLCISLGGWFTYQLVLFKSSDYRLGLLAMIFYFSLYGRYSSYFSDCNLAIMCSAIVPVFMYYFELKKYAAAALSFVFLIIGREDFSLWLIFICLFLAIIHRKEKKQLVFASTLTFISLLSFVVIFTLVIPALEDENKKFTLFNFAALGNGPLEALLFLFSHPFKAIQLLFVNHLPDAGYADWKMRFYWVYGLSGGALLLYRPVYLIAFIPLIAKKMYNDNPIRWSIDTYYSVEVATLLPVAVFLIIAGFSNKRIQLALATLVCIITLIVTFKTSLVYDNSKFNFLNKAFYKSGMDTRRIYSSLKKIPVEAVVTASGRIVPHLAMRPIIYLFPKVADSDYVFLLKKGDAYPVSGEEYDRLLNKLLISSEFEVTENTEDFVLLTRRKP